MEGHVLTRCPHHRKQSLVSSKVNQGYCNPTGDCAATKFVVEGCTHDKDGGVRYVLECVEIIVGDAHQVTCARLHAHADDNARIYSQSVAFGSRSSSHNDPVQIDYTIKSEREIKNKKE